MVSPWTEPLVNPEVGRFWNDSLKIRPHLEKIRTLKRSVCVCVCVCSQSVSHSRLSATPWTVATQASLSLGFFQARILEWVAISSPGDLPDTRIFPTRDQTQFSCVSCIGKQILYHWATREALKGSIFYISFKTKAEDLRARLIICLSFLGGLGGEKHSSHKWKDLEMIQQFLAQQTCPHSISLAFRWPSEIWSL